MEIYTLLLCILTQWYLKVTSLPTLYYELSNRRGIEINKFKRLEKLAYKVTKWKLDIQYFEDCQYLKICPEFLKFKAPRLKVYNDSTGIYGQVVREQISVLQRELQAIRRRYDLLKTEIVTELSYLEKSVYLTLLNRSIKQSCERVLTNHEKKLRALWKVERFKSPDCLMNLSNRTLTVIEEDALRFGLKHHILPKNIDGDVIKISVERCLTKINHDLLNDAPFASIFRDKVKYAVNSFLASCKTVCSARTNKTLHRVLSDLRSDETIKVCSFDKGNGIVILDSQDYYNKLDLIISDASKFVEIAQSDADQTIIDNETSIQNYVYKYIRPNVDKSEYFKIRPTGSQPGKLYGLCKVHKPNNPLRPVVSMIGTAGYELAKYLDKWIKPCIPDDYMLNSTTSFLDKLKAFAFNPKDKLISFDVESLFTNVPINETIDLIANYVYAQDEDKQPPFKKLIFKRMLTLATGGFFMYNGKMYQQVDGVTMGSPLGPTLANFFLAHYESKLLSVHKEFHPRLYLRYVDDVFAVFSNDIDFKMFFDKLNTQHNNLRFTFEIGSDSLPFLDTEISIKNGDFESWIYRKKTNTNVLLNNTAICPFKWKVGLMTCLINRAWQICSSRTRFDEEIEKLKAIFQQNGYSGNLFMNKVKLFINGKSNSESQKVVADAEMSYLLMIPYVGKPSLIFKRKMTEIVRDIFDVKLRCAYTSCKVKNYFSLKCPSSPYLASNVVYKYTCRCDTDTVYIGETKIHIGTRAGQHMDIQADKPTAVAKHIRECESCYTACEQGQLSFKDFPVVKQCKSKFDAEIKEAILILKEKPLINKQLFKSGSSFTLKIFG
jgi:hypothetical protein